jgi:hypothetical protein
MTYRHVCSISFHFIYFSPKGFYASVYLSIAEDYRKSNMIEYSKKYINLAEKSTYELEDNGYGNMIKHGIERIKEKIRNRTTAST